MEIGPETTVCSTKIPSCGGLSKGVLYVAVGAVFFSLANVLVKLAGHHLPSMEIVFGRSIVGIVICWWFMRRKGVSMLGRNRLILSVRGLLGAGGLVCSFYAITHMPLADSVVLFHINPVFAVILAFLFLGERLVARAAVCIPLCIVGVVLITRPPFLFGEAGTAIPGFVYAVALLSAVFAGGAYTAMHHLGGREHSLTIVFYLYLVAIPISLVGMIPGWITPTWTETLMLAGIGVLTQVAQLCLAIGLRLESTGTATATGSLQVAFAALWGMLVFDEFPGMTAYAGAGILILGTLILSGSIRLPGRHGAPKACATTIK